MKFGIGAMRAILVTSPCYRALRAEGAFTRFKCRGGLHLALALIAVLSAFAVAACGDVVLDTGHLSLGRDFTNNGTASSATNTVFTSLPTAVSSSNSVGTGYFATSIYALSGTGFSTAVTDRRGGVYGTYAGAQGYVYFTATDASTYYTLTGNYTFSTPYVEFSEGLYDLTTNTYVGYYSEDTYNNYSTSGGTFTVGGLLTGQAGTISGKLSGVLTSDEYEFIYNGSIEAYPNADSGATGSGTFGIAFTEGLDPNAATTPLPSTAYAGLGLLGGLGVLTLARRRTADVG